MGTRFQFSASEVNWIKENAHLSRKQLMAAFRLQFDRPEVTIEHLLGAKRRAGLPGVERAQLSPFGRKRVQLDGVTRVQLREPCKGYKGKTTYLHIIEWCWVNGPIPDGMLLVCRGDRSNPSPDNWELMCKSARSYLNWRSPLTFNDAPDELKPSLIALARLKHAAASKTDRRGAHDNPTTRQSSV